MNIIDIPINNIKSSENIRLAIKDTELINLMQTIKDNGLLQPIGVKEEGEDKYKILWGNRRLLACKKLGWKTIPSYIFSNQDEEMTEQQFWIINTIENFQRKDNSMFDLGRVVKKLKKDLSPSEIATRLGISKQRILDASEEFSRLPVYWQKKIKLMTGGEDKKGDIPVNSAMVIVRLRVPMEIKEKILKEISKNELSTDMVTLIGSLMKQGFSFEEAKEKVSEYKMLSVRVFVNRKKLEEELIQYKGRVTDFVTDTFNLRYPKFAFRNVSR